ncbi:TPA: head-tail adaptor protein [Clostridium botulinum]|nr:head-tail adaptor protein [Clostridium botulinum]
MINTGKMREHIYIKKKKTVYKKGFPKDEMIDYYDCRAELLDLIGAEKYSALQVKLENSIKFKCRSCEKLKALVGEKLTDYILIWNDKEYSCKFIDSMNGSLSEIVIQVQRVY